MVLAFPRSPMITAYAAWDLVPHRTYDEIPAVLTQWYSGLCSGINLPVPAEDADDGRFGALLDSCRQIPTAAIT
jgi:hypothetical protein